MLPFLVTCSYKAYMTTALLNVTRKKNFDGMTIHFDTVHELSFTFSISLVFQNTIEGYLAYFPIVGRLKCDSTYVDHQGRWELSGWGLLSVYKSDWMRFGGRHNKKLLPKQFFLTKSTKLFLPSFLSHELFRYIKFFTSFCN